MEEKRVKHFPAALVREVQCAHGCGASVAITQFTLDAAARMNHLAVARDLEPMRTSEIALCAGCQNVHADDQEDTCRRKRASDLEYWVAYRAGQLTFEALMQAVDDDKLYRQLARTRETFIQRRASNRRAGGDAKKFAR